MASLSLRCTVACLLSYLAMDPNSSAAEAAVQLRPPAVPLVTHDPYFSVWSTSDRLTETWPRHWTGTVQAMCGLARIDGKTYRFMGMHPKDVEPMEQKRVEVLPTRTIYEFQKGGVALQLTFLTPSLPHNLDLLSRPLTYIEATATSTDGSPHQVSVYLDASAELAVNSPQEEVAWSRLKAKDLSVLRLGTTAQRPLNRAGDDLRIDWGYLYLAAPSQQGTDTVISGHGVREQFTSGGELPAADDLRMPRQVSDQWPVLACTLDLGSVKEAPVSRHVMLAYDDLYSIEYLNRRCRPYWRRNGMDASQLLSTAASEFPQIKAECEKYDQELMADLARAGGEKYAKIAALSFRQCIAAHKLVADFDGKPLFFSKENFSNGCIATIDVTYPSSPFFLLLNPELLKAQLTPVLEYAASPRWKFPFAPHDLGTYPLANGQVYGGGERTEENQMPVEECGNFLLMLAALAKIDGNADYSVRYWPTVTKWAEYLAEKGLDPENQLCTDDFAGHLAHNSNLSLKAILALGGYAQLCAAAGKHDDATSYTAMARQMAEQWAKMADDQTHYRLTFDKPGTWSQKYNLVWDRLLGLNIFPAEIAQKEVAHYKKIQGRYGLPLDNRNVWTKLDWIVWSATLAEQAEDFHALVAPVYDFVNATPQRVPLTDWYRTDNAHHVGFQARSVVGGVYIPLLKDESLWKKWSSRAASK